MAARPWTLPAPSGSETLRAPARSSSSDCSLTTAAPRAGQVVAGAEGRADDGRAHVDELGGDGPDGRGVHAGVVGDALGQDRAEHRLELALVRQQFAGRAAPGELAGEQHARRCR